ncbi:MAG: HAD-IA family hydrolase [Acidobacteria bacterium]|nr:HAD-IA family hydrolase [Acidobacteriota bacterium]
MGVPGFERVRAIVFDLDGTLIDSYEAIAVSLNHALELAGKPPKSFAEVRGLVGLGLETLIERALGGPEGVAGAVEDFRRHYDRVCVGMTTLLPEVAETLAELDRRGYAMSIATNKPSYFAWRLLEGLHVRRHVTAVFGPDVVENRKPHPEMVLTAMLRMGVTPAQTLYVGDMEVDVETARAAGVPVVVVPTGSRSAAELAEARPDRLLSSLKDLLDLVPRVAPPRSPAPK